MILLTYMHICTRLYWRLLSVVRLNPHYCSLLYVTVPQGNDCKNSHQGACHSICYTNSQSIY